MRKVFVMIISVIVAMVGVRFAPIIARADFTPGADFESRDVMEDLNGATINDVVFDIADYPMKESGEMQVLTFLEYCYSYRKALQKSYGLYVYFYNPQGLSIRTSSSLNKIQIRFGGRETDNYHKFSLIYLNKCEIEGKEGLFYKFKVVMTDSQKESVLSDLDNESRIYEVGGFEFSTNRGYKEYRCGLKYVYTGYAKGYGADDATDSTLKCTVSGIIDHISIDDIGFTYYRPEGTNGEDFKQDNLHTVYFAVPNEYVKKYGEMTAVHATWYNAVLRPILITGNATAYVAFKPWIGKNWTFDNSIGFGYLGGAEVNNMSNASYWEFGYYLNSIDGGYYDGLDGNARYNCTKYGGAVNPLYYMFYAGEGDNSADTYRLSSKQLSNRLKQSYAEFGGSSVCDDYSSNIFESYDTEPVDLTIQADKQYELTSQTFSRSWFQQLFGGKSLVGTTISTMNAIEEVTSEKVKGTAETVINRLFIADSDYTDFMNYYNRYKSDSKIYLFRYMTSEYVAEEASLVKIKGGRIDTNAYFFKETVNLKFDIIDLTFTRDGVTTVIPAVMTPIDIIHESTPPVETIDDTADSDWWKKLLMIVAIIFLIILLLPFLPYIIKGIVWVIMLPFRIVGWIIKALKQNKNE